MNIVIDKEFQSLIPALTTDEYRGLEESILSEGCRDALVLWGDTLIDGHNRYSICQKYDIPFKTVQREFANRNTAIEWIILNQFGRRNLPAHERARQIIDFSGVKFNRITPTDVDGLIEYKNIAYVLMEFKHREAEMPDGQKLALTRMVDDFDRQGKYAALFVCEHYVDDPKADIIAKNTNVRRYYYRGKWYPAIDRSFFGKNTYQTVKNFIEMVEKTDKLF